MLERHGVNSAIAYLKAAEPDDPQPFLELSHNDSPVLRQFSSGLLVAYVTNEGDSFRYVQNQDLDATNMSLSQLHDIGIANLSARASGVARVVPYKSIFAVLLDGSFEASLILVDRLWDDEFRAFVEGDYAAVIPARDVLAFGAAESMESHRELLAVVERVGAAADHRLTDRVMIRTAGRWNTLD